MSTNNPPTHKDSNAAALDAISFSAMNPQSACPLYISFPPEIRRYIFSYALSAYEDLDAPWDAQSYYRRPGYTCRKRTDVAVLRTCKLVYVEARDLIFQAGTGNDEEAFWWGDFSRRPPENRPPDHLMMDDDDGDDDEWDEEGFEDDWEEEGGRDYIMGGDLQSSHQYASVEPNDGPVPGGVDEAVVPDANPTHQVGENTSESATKLIIQHYINKFFHDSPFQSHRTVHFSRAQWSRIKKIRIFPQMYTLSKENITQFFHRIPCLRPETVHITIRYTDWWWWENDTALDLTIRPSLVDYYLPESCNTLILELETIDSKRKDLDEQVKRVIDEKALWRWKRLDDEYLMLDQEKGIKEWEWMGPTTIGGETFNHHPKAEEMKYVVKILTFTAKPTEAKDLASKSFGDVFCMKSHVPFHSS
ncbi:hypothetical protein FA15DRAFT_671738 [Coprinopsis marcescibilis]|uniref:F-box domain-containing protein n=1 Tax=Coprinopsis marcescibilis TaxID=230819 RepID=A0A5C3L212_COPMA|nr:hypothetical protein FA15DRAFT_671738 [Coprinopsis marcescibilis]